MSDQSKSKVKVLDHGYVEFIEAWGHGKDGIEKNLPDRTVTVTQSADFEVGIIEAARQSTQGSFRGWDGVPCNCAFDSFTVRFPKETLKHAEGCPYQPGDAKLLSFLYSHKHFTPFEFSGMILEVQAPIFVFREWHRHRTQSYNEMSARYAPLPDLYYVPDVERIMQGSGHITNNKQAQGTGAELTEAQAFAWRSMLQNAYQWSEDLYQDGLKGGIPKELARCIMPVGHYSRMRCSANLRNWLAFCTLRCDPQAQWEIRQFAGVVAELIREKFPRTCKLWFEESF